MPWWRARRVSLVFSVACLSLLAACSPVSRLRVRVILPSGAKSILYVTGAQAVPPAVAAAPAPAASSGDANRVTQVVESGTIVVTADFRGKHRSASLTAWIDSDGDGKPSSGDFVGSTPAIDIHDRGIFSGNLTRSPDLVLSRVP